MVALACRGLALLGLLAALAVAGCTAADCASGRDRCGVYGGVSGGAAGW